MKLWDWVQEHRALHLRDRELILESVRSHEIDPEIIVAYEHREDERNGVFLSRRVYAVTETDLIIIGAYLKLKDHNHVVPSQIDVSISSYPLRHISQIVRTHQLHFDRDFVDSLNRHDLIATVVFTEESGFEAHVLPVPSDEENRTAYQEFCKTLLGRLV